MAYRKLHYQFLPRQGEAVGACSLVHPFLLLWEQVKICFLRESIRRLVSKVAVPALGDLLEECEFGPGTFSFDEWFQHYEASPLRLAWDTKSLQKLSDLAEDLTRDNGLWKETAADLDTAERDAVAAIERRLQRVCQEVAVRFGPGTVPQVLAVIRRRFSETASSWQNSPPWTSRLSEDLLQAARTLRSYALPRTVGAKLLRRISANVSASWWLSDGQRRNLERKVFPQIAKAHLLRFAHECDRRRRRLTEALLGRPDRPGLLDWTLGQWLGQEEYFHQLTTALGATAPEASLEPNTLYTAESLDTAIDSARKRTLGDLYQQALARSGCSAEDFAAQLQRDGLLLRGRTYKPVEWAHQPLPEVLEALHRAADLYLGSHDENAPLRLDEPKTAFEAAATITPLHPELEPLVLSLLPRLVQRSMPYAEIHPVSGGEPHVHSLLYCYPLHRPQWERLLRTRINLVGAKSAGDDGTAYQVCHPYVLTLVQFAVAAPLGAFPSLSSWTHQANLLQQSGHTPLFDVTGAPEVRRLTERPLEYEDCRQLFSAASKARFFSPLGNSDPLRYAPVTVDPRLEILFAPESFTPEWKTEEYFHEALRSPSFIRSLEIAFPAVTDLRMTAARLGREEDAHLVATTLVELGILEAAASARHFRVRSQGPAGVLRPDLFERQKGSMQGLTEEECIAALNRNDDLYNTVFWQVCDALDFGRISPNDVPAFLVNFRKTL